MTPTAILVFKDGTTEELLAEEGMSRTVFVDKKGWRHTSWWSTASLATADFEGTRTRCLAAGTLARTVRSGLVSDAEGERE